MCGITGIIHYKNTPVSATAIQAMTDALAHRGPDEAGAYCYRNAGLGHRRLRTIDLSPLGSQPMHSACGNFTLVYNGMLYNYRELRAELQALGFALPSTGDSAVVLSAWSAWGAECVRRFNGHFAFAVIDKRKNTIFLVRDRYGTRPLYWWRGQDALLFASEIKAFLPHPSFRPQVDLEALPEYFTFQNFFGARTLFKGVNLFPKASIGAISLDCPSEPRITTYWDYDFQEPETPVKPAAYLDELDFLLRQAVNRQLAADVEVGAYLSGGIDSGLISALAASDQRYIKSFTCGFDVSSASGLELGFDERAKAEAMSAIFKTEQYEMVLKSGDMERSLPHVVRHIEEPRVGQSYPNYYMAKLASKFVRIALSGAGGDELFGGYPWRYYRICAKKDFPSFTDGYYKFWQRLVPETQLPEFLAPVWKQAGQAHPRDVFQNVFRNGPTTIKAPEDAINLSLYFEAHTFLQGLLLVEDKLSMAHGLETRAPFLDNDLVEFAMRCPVSFKLNNLKKAVAFNENDPGPKSDYYYQRAKDGKAILRQVAQKYIPVHIAQAGKQGFSAPDASWFKGESIEFVRKHLLHSGRRIYDYIDYSAATAFINEHIDGTTNRRLLIWSLLYFDFWLNEFIP